MENKIYKKLDFIEKTSKENINICFAKINTINEDKIKNFNLEKKEVIFLIYFTLKNNNKIDNLQVLDKLVEKFENFSDYANKFKSEYISKNKIFLIYLNCSLRYDKNYMGNLKFNKYSLRRVKSKFHSFK